MKISYNWLKEYLKFDLLPAALSDVLTSLGLEVESMEPWESIPGGLKGFIIGKVLTCEKHPNADKLSVTTVDIGSGTPLNIVCGAPNVAAGQKVLVATIGTTVFHGKETFEIKKAKIRGVESAGMICAEDEVGIGTSHEGIMVLDEKAQVGQPAANYFNIVTDTAFEIGLTPNRIDAASHYGIARDLAASLSRKSPVKAVLPSVDAFPLLISTPPPVDVVIENVSACRRYAGVTIKDVTIKPSPEWLQNKLKAIGLNPINNVVDITNFVLYETGQPLHSFDADKIKGNKVVVKNLPAGTVFKTLDGVDRTLHQDDLIICNAIEGMALAGVFGGMESGITDQTHRVFLESAYFDPVSVRRTARRHGLSTDASFRFERGVDPNMILYALKRAALLITELSGGAVDGCIVDNYPSPVNDFEVKIAYCNVNSLIGKDIPSDTIRTILESLEMEILHEDKEGMMLRVPAYRVDVQREADVIEEILRVYGYNNVEIPSTLHASLAYSQKPDTEKITNLISDYLTGTGFTEIMCNSLTKSSYYENNEVYPATNLVKIYNPLSADLSCMRQTLLYGGLEVIGFNSNRKNTNLKLYEVGNVYFYHQDAKGENHLNRYSEYQHFDLFLTGLRTEPNWTTPGKPIDFFYLKGCVQYVLQRLGLEIESLEAQDFSDGIFHMGVRYMQKDRVIVEFGLVNPHLSKSFDCRNEVFFADFHWNTVIDLVKRHSVQYQELPRFPEVHRDLSMVLDQKVTYEQLRELAFRTERHLLKHVTLFDVYTGDKIEAGKKSYALTFVLQDTSGTLTDKQIDKVMQRLMKTFESELGAVIRQ